jgi:hypothetical protein
MDEQSMLKKRRIYDDNGDAQPNSQQLWALPPQQALIDEYQDDGSRSMGIFQVSSPQTSAKKF